MENGKWKITHTEQNPTCGDEITIGLTAENDQIKELAWSGEGCAISQAAMSLIFEEYGQTSVSDLNHLQKADIYELLGVPISNRRMKCALLGLHALKNALRQAEGKEEAGWLESVLDEDARL